MTTTSSASQTASADAGEGLRALGYSVAVHNDYRLGGKPHTFWLWTHPDGHWIKGEGGTDAEALAECQRLAALRQTSSEPVALTVWYGSMPESNGKSNWTAMLKRTGGNAFSSFADGIIIERSEYPDRVRYEADRMRWLIGERAERPNLLEYDADLHSGHVAPAAPEHAASERVRVLSIGDQVRHVHMGVKGVIRTEVEGWWGVEWSDGSVAVVRPSALNPQGQEKGV